MGVGIAFLRPRPDGTWEGDYTSAGWVTFGELQDLIDSLPGYLYFLSFREEEYDVDISQGTPPYPAQVSPELAKDLERWRKDVGSRLREALQQIPPEEVEEHTRWLKSLIEQRLAEGYAIMVSF